MTETPQLDPASPSRRTVLAGAAALGAGGLLAACGSSTSSSAPAPPAKGTKLVATADVPVGGGTVLPDTQLVVTQPSRGTYEAFSAVCTHQGCLVAAVADKQIQCNCHGSRFSIKDGSVVNGPATLPLAPTAVTVAGGEVVVA